MFIALTYSCGVQQNFIFHLIFFVVYYNFPIIYPKKYKRKRGKPLRKKHPGDHMSGFASSRRQNTRFSSLRWKHKLDL